jgi:hypothetical protein
MRTIQHRLNVTFAFDIFLIKPLPLIWEKTRKSISKARNSNPEENA